MTAPEITRKCGGRGTIAIKRKWTWATSGQLFPSRAGSKKGFVSKDVVSAMIRKVRPSFVEAHGKQHPCLASQAVRSHSGCRHMISWMAGQGASESQGMMYAGVDSPKDYRGYIKPDAEAVGQSLTRLDLRAPLATAAKRNRA